MRKYFLIIFLIDFLFITHLLFSQEIIWKHTGGPMGGIIGDIAINSNGDIYGGMYGSHPGGLFKSTNNGEAWEHIETQFEEFEVYAIYITEEGHIFVGTNFQGRIYRSTDNGVTWENTRQGYDTGECWAFGESNDGVIFAGDGQYNKLYRSNNNGNNWELSANLSSLVFVTDSNNIVYCGTFDGLFFTTDNGITWSENEYFSNRPVSAMLIDKNNGIYCGTGYYDDGDGVFYSSDGGENWKQLGLGGKIVLSLAFNSSGNLYAGTPVDGLFYTDDMGTTWHNYTNGLYRKQIFRLEVNQEDDIFIGSENEGVFRSINGGESFSQIGLPASRVGNIIFSGDSLIFASTTSGVQKYQRKTNKWTNMGLQHVQQVAFAPNGDLFAATGDLPLFVSNVSAGLFRSTDNGDSWSIFAFEDTVVWNVLLTKENIIYVITELEGLMRSYDYGSTWEILPYYSNYWSRALEEGIDGEIYFTALGNDPITLYKISSDGITITPLIDHINTILNNSLSVNDSIIFLADNVDGGRGGIYRSIDSGINWENVASEPRAYCIYAKSNGIVYSGSDLGLYYSTDFGDTWLITSYQLDSLGRIREIEEDQNGKLFFGTNKGLYNVDIITAVENGENPLIPNEFSLSQNYPNPFNPTTTIQYELPTTALVTLKIYDILGSEVATLVNEEKPAGTYEVEFSASGGGSNLASGIYIYRLTSSGFTASKKLILLK